MSICGCILIFTQTTRQQQLNNILKDIKAVNEVHCEGVGIAGEKSSQYSNYESLLKAAKTSELLELTKVKNAVVNCYATWALIERRFSGVAAIFSKYLHDDKAITSFCGCTKQQSVLSQEVYFRYHLKKDHDEKTMNTMDSLVLYSANSGWLLIHFALESRIYPPTYNNRLEQLAFKQLNTDAISYLNKQYGKKYQLQIRLALLSYLERTDFSKTGTSDYFDVVSKLLKYRNDNINKAVLKKLKNDTHWECDFGKFYGLLSQYKLEKTFQAKPFMNKYKSDVLDKAYETKLKDSSCRFWSVLLNDNTFTSYLGIDKNHLEQLTIFDENFSKENCRGYAKIKNVRVIKKFEYSNIGDKQKTYCFINASWYNNGKYGMTIVANDHKVIWAWFIKRDGHWIISKLKKKD